MPALQGSPDWQIVGACDPSPDRRAWAESALPGVPLFSHTGRMLSETGPQAVLVATPPADHLSATRAALGHCLHVLVEKPAGLDGAQAREMAAAAKAAGVVLQAGLNRRFHPVYRRLRAALAQRQPASDWCVRYTLQASPNDWDSVSGFLGRELGGGVAFDLGSHALDLLPWLFSTSIQAVEVIRPHEPWRQRIESILHMESGVEVRCSLGHAGDYREELEAVRPDGALIMVPTGILARADDQIGRLRSRAEDRYWLDRKWIRLGLMREHMLESFRGEWADFAGAVRDGPSASQACRGEEIVGLHRWLQALEPEQEWRGGRPRSVAESRARTRTPAAPRRVGTAAEAPEDLKASLILVVGRRRWRAGLALRSLLEQEGIEAAEVILVDMGPPGSPPLPGSEHPRVQNIRCETMVPFGVARAEAVRTARAPLVAFLEEHCRVHPGWLRAILHAFDGPWAAVGPRVVSANPGMGLTDAMGEINYGGWTADRAGHEAKMLPGNNSAYRRQALLDLGDSLADLLMTDTVLQMRLMAEGGRLYVEPKAVIAHRYPVTLWSASKGEYLYHVGFAWVRAEAFHWSWLRRLGYAAASVVIPWLRLSRLLRGTGGGSVRPGSLRLAVGLVVLLHAAVLGQAAGLLLGMRHAALRFTDYELNEPRPAREDPPSGR